MLIQIKNLRLRTLIGIQDWEREKKQDVIVNVRIEFDGAPAASSDDIRASVDYKTLTKRIIDEVESSQFFLLERLSSHLVALIMEDPRVQSATVEVDKPGALRFAESVSVTASAERRP